MKCSEIIEILEKLAPSRFACDWDNPGLLAGRREKEVNTILLTLDVDDEAVKTAKDMGADMIISHHPLIFKPVKRVTDEDFIGRRLVAMIQADICCFAMHTNFDAAPGCMADAVAEKIGICSGEPLEEMGEEDGIAYGIGKIGELDRPVSGLELARHIKEQFHLPCITVYGNPGWEETSFGRAAVCPGSGGSTIQASLDKKAQVLVTGDISHHEGIDANAQGLVIFDAGHYGLEHIFMDHMERYLKDTIGDAAQIIKMPVKFPAGFVI